MNPYFTKMMQNSMAHRNPMMKILQQVQQVRSHPEQLASLLQQQGIVNSEQAQEIQKMGCHYGQIGQYLINNGVMPNNIPQSTIDQAKNFGTSCPEVSK